jgi:hypothetical protein
LDLLGCLAMTDHPSGIRPTFRVSTLRVDISKLMRTISDTVIVRMSFVDYFTPITLSLIGATRPAGFLNLLVLRCNDQLADNFWLAIDYLNTVVSHVICRIRRNSIGCYFQCPAIRLNVKPCPAERK